MNKFKEIIEYAMSPNDLRAQLLIIDYWLLIIALINTTIVYSAGYL